jgi:hypothetical protein
LNTSQFVLMLIELLKNAQNVTKLYPGLSDGDLRILQEQLPGPIPKQYKELLTACAGFETKQDVVSLDGSRFRKMHPQLGQLIPFGYPVMFDLCGNFWALDILEDGTWSSVMYCCYDPLALVKQFDDLECFLKAVLSGQIDHRNDGDALDHAIATESGIPQTEALNSNDPLIRDFAAKLAPDFRIFDLRRESGTKGFEFSPDVAERRFGTELLFAVQWPGKKPGFFASLFK